MERRPLSEWSNTTPDLTSPPLTPLDDADLALRERAVERLITALLALLIAAIVLRLALSF